MFFILVLTENENLQIRCTKVGGVDVDEIPNYQAKDYTEFDKGFIHIWEDFEDIEEKRYVTRPSAARCLYNFMHKDLLQVNIQCMSSPLISKLKVQVIQSHKDDSERPESDDSQEVLNTPTHRIKKDTQRYSLRHTVKSPERYQSDPIENEFSEKKPDGVFYKDYKAISYFETKSGSTETYTPKRLENAIIQNLSFALPDIVEVNKRLKRDCHFFSVLLFKDALVLAKIAPLKKDTTKKPFYDYVLVPTLYHFRKDSEERKHSLLKTFLKNYHDYIDEELKERK